MRCLLVLPVTVLCVSLATAENMNKKRTLADSSFGSHTALLGAYTIPTFYTVPGAINPVLGDSLGRNGNGHVLFVGGNHEPVLPGIPARGSYRADDSRKVSESEDDSYDNSEEKENVSVASDSGKTEAFGSADNVKEMYNDHKIGGVRTGGHSGSFRSHSGGRTGATFIGRGHGGSATIANHGRNGGYVSNGYVGGYEGGRAGGSQGVVGGGHGIVGLDGNKPQNSFVRHFVGSDGEAHSRDSGVNNGGSSEAGHGFGSFHGFSDAEESSSSGSFSGHGDSEMRTHGDGIGGGHVSGIANHDSSLSTSGRGYAGTISAYTRPIAVHSSGGYGGNYGGYGGNYGGGSNADFVADHGNNEVIIEVGHGEGISGGHYGGSGSYFGASGGHGANSGSHGGYGSGGYGNGGYGGVSGGHGVGYGGGYASGGSGHVAGGGFLFHKGGGSTNGLSGGSYGSYGGGSASHKGSGGGNGGGSGKATSYQTVHLESFHAVPVYFKNEGKH